MTSWTYGGTHTFSCQVQNPNSLRFCDNPGAFRHLYKLSASYPLPFNTIVSGNFQITDTGDIGASYSVNSLLAGVPITGGGSLSVQLVPPDSYFTDYYKNFDVRFAKTMMMGGGRLVALAEFDNILNLPSVGSVVGTYGSRWLRPTSIQRGRNIRFGIQARF
jgi:hypothetical protein